MGIERLLNLVEKRVKDVPPVLFGYHGSHQMRQYLRQVLLVYEQVKEEEKQKRLRYPEMPLSWNQE
jgi:hypothetical protein